MSLRRPCVWTVFVERRRLSSGPYTELGGSLCKRGGGRGPRYTPLEDGVSGRYFLVERENLFPVETLEVRTPDPEINNGRTKSRRFRVPPE